MVNYGQCIPKQRISASVFLTYTYAGALFRWIPVDESVSSFDDGDDLPPLVPPSAVSDSDLPALVPAAPPAEAIKSSAEVAATTSAAQEHRQRVWEQLAQRAGSGVARAPTEPRPLYPGIDMARPLDTITTTAHSLHSATQQQTESKRSAVRTTQERNLVASVLRERPKHFREESGADDPEPPAASAFGDVSAEEHTVIIEQVIRLFFHKRMPLLIFYFVREAILAVHRISVRALSTRGATDGCGSRSAC